MELDSNCKEKEQKTVQENVNLDFGNIKLLFTF